MKFVNFDPVIFLCVVVLTSLGLATLSSVAPEVFWQQFFFSLLGLFSFLIFNQIDYHLIKPFAKLIYVFSIIGLGSTILFGIASHGAVRWIPIGSFRLQFSEVFKPFLIVAFAGLLADSEMNLKKIVFSILWQLPILFLIFSQPDLGGTLVYLAGFNLMFFVSGINIKIFVTMLFASLGTLPIIWQLLASYQKERIVTFLNPGHDVLGSSYNAVQSVITVGSGMLFGKGLGRGTQSHLFFLPEKHTDFIFASFAEEFGLVGVTFMLAVFFILLVRLIHIYDQTRDPLGRLIVVGVLGMFLFQVTINIGMNLGLVPITGITLPLISYGGSSVLASLTGLGIVSSVSKKS